MMPGTSGGMNTMPGASGGMTAMPGGAGGMTAMPGVTGGMATMTPSGSSESLAATASTTAAAACCSVASATAASALGMDGATANVVGQAATNAAMGYVNNIASIGSDYSSSRLAVLRYYFDVNNAYVLQKLKILLLPYRQKDWSRQVTTVAGGRYQPLPPCQDSNAPDLYLPLMSFVTYVLVAGFVMGTYGRFTPEVLASTASWGISIVCFEVAAMKATLYLISATGEASVLDLTSTSGYKFFFAVFVVLAKSLAGTIAFYSAIGVAAANIGTFMGRTLQQSLSETGGISLGFMAEGPGSPRLSEKKRKQNLALLGVALGLQPFWFWFLSV